MKTCCGFKHRAKIEHVSIWQFCFYSKWQFDHWVRYWHWVEFSPAVKVRDDCKPEKVELYLMYTFSIRAASKCIYLFSHHFSQVKMLVLHHSSMFTIKKKTIDHGTIEVIQYCLCTLMLSVSGEVNVQSWCCFTCAETKVQIMVQHHMDWSQTKGGDNVPRNVSSNSQTHPENDADRNQERDLFVHMSCRMASATEMAGCMARETYVCLAGLFQCWQC